jgi:D-serine deaminase-like pyridoxal phosphate-dependent protein
MSYLLHHPEKVYSPSLLFYRTQIINNISRMINLAGSADRLVPHVKTHKTAEIVKLQLEEGITKFKCATIAEAEMVAQAGGKWILLAYQMVGPNIDRLFALRKDFPDVTFLSLIDHESPLEQLNAISIKHAMVSPVFIDINNGMNRTGCEIGPRLNELIKKMKDCLHIKLKGLHVYDGHIHTEDFLERKQIADQAFESIREVVARIKEEMKESPMIIAGGSPTFTVHQLRDQVYLSPGTNVLWDDGYASHYQEQAFDYGALLLTRVISKPTTGIITIDLGHKAVAAENPIEKRFRILYLPDYTLLSQSEEHGVLRVDEETWESLPIGTVLYAVPYHVCPTVALHQTAYVIEEGIVIDEWNVIARNRVISL